MLWGQVSIWGQLGSLGSKGHFHWKCCNLSMLHSMTIRLIHVHQLETLYLLNEVKCQPGVIWGHRGQKVIFSKMLLLLQNTWCYLYVTQCIYVAYKYALTWDSLLHSVGQGQLEITSSGRVRHLWWQMCLVTVISSLRIKQPDSHPFNIY